MIIFPAGTVLALGDGTLRVETVRIFGYMGDAVPTFGDFNNLVVHDEMWKAYLHLLALGEEEEKKERDGVLNE